jgi:serine/threonine-protein kinase
MGEVYRALDKNLGRQVAIKFLPEEFSADLERLARFEREAKLLATLNHPNIAAVYGFEEAGGARFLVMELVGGDTVQTRLNRGALPVDEALETCRQVAEGLEAAHERGVVHRDLKPGNIMITPEGKVKILDFGLAKAYGGETTSIDIEKSPTITAQMTEPGIILGTAAYMSPEQATGRPVDKRADIWAFGCVLFECLTGKRAFPGNTVTESLAAILRGEPDWQALPPATPWRVKDLLRRCLRKNPRERLHDIADARIELGEPSAYPSEAVSATRRFPLLWLGLCGAIILFAGIFIDRVLTGRFKPVSSTPIVTSTIKVEPGTRLAGVSAWGRPSLAPLAISRDGRFVVYCAPGLNGGPQAVPQLYLRRMDQAEAKPIAGTEEGAGNPFLSPDDRWVGFFAADDKLKKIPVEGGIPGTLCDASQLFGASWGPDNSIVFADGMNGGLSRVSAEGGKPETLTKPDPKREESSHRLPFWLPNGKAILFTVMRRPWDIRPSVALLKLDTREWGILLPDAADAKYVPTGHLVFMREGTLMGVRFDEARLKVIGQPIALMQNVIQSAYGDAPLYNSNRGLFSISDTGSLIYAAGGVLPDMQNSLMWVDQKGAEKPVTDLKFPFTAPRLSPDGQRIAYVALLGQESRVWVYDLSRDTNSPLTGGGLAFFPIWNLDGKRIVFGWGKSLVPNLFSQPYDGSSPMERLTTSEHEQYPSSWSPDGNTVAVAEINHENGQEDISVLDVRSGRLTPFLNSPFNETYPDFSPDGRLIAYTSDESGREEVYVRDFPGPGMKQQVSNQGGAQPLWARKGRQIFYLRGDQVWAVDVRTEGGSATSKPRLLFEKPGYDVGGPVRVYDLSQDGQRFLMVNVEQRKSTPITEMILIQNWFEELKRLVPAGKK